MTQLTADFNAGTGGANIQTSDPGSANAWDVITRSGGANQIQYDNTHFYGSLAAKHDAQSGSANWLEWGTSLGTVTDHYGRVYIYYTANPGGTITMLQCLSTASLAAQIFLNTTGHIVVNDSVGTILTFTNPIALNQWVRYEYHIIHSATVGQVEVKMFNNPDSGTATETQTSTANKNTLASANTLRFGQISTF